MTVPHFHRAEDPGDPRSCAAGGKAAPMGTTPRKDLLETGSISHVGVQVLEQAGDPSISTSDKLGQTVSQKEMIGLN